MHSILTNVAWVRNPEATLLLLLFSSALSGLCPGTSILLLLLLKNHLFQLIESGMIKNHCVDFLYPIPFLFFPANFATNTSSPTPSASGQKMPRDFYFHTRARRSVRCTKKRPSYVLQQIITGSPRRPDYMPVAI